MVHQPKLTNLETKITTLTAEIGRESLVNRPARLLIHKIRS